MVYGGSPGHLATCTSAEENAFVFSLVVQSPDAVWLGGYQEPITSPPDVDWHWVTGEPWDYTNWCPGEPNDFRSDDAYLVLWNCPVGNRWNDWPTPSDGTFLAPFVVEYSQVQTATERSTWGTVKRLFH
jgi:hypothetical protein